MAACATPAVDVIPPRTKTLSTRMKKVMMAMAMTCRSFVTRAA